jgi:hypothetical protein
LLRKKRESKSAGADTDPDTDTDTDTDTDADTDADADADADADESECESECECECECESADSEADEDENEDGYEDSYGYEDNAKRPILAEWWSNGKPHRKKGPAKEYTNCVTEYYHKGVRHRSKGHLAIWVCSSFNYGCGYYRGMCHAENTQDFYDLCRGVYTCCKYAGCGGWLGGDLAYESLPFTVRYGTIVRTSESHLVKPPAPLKKGDRAYYQDGLLHNNSYGYAVRRADGTIERWERGLRSGVEIDQYRYRYVEELEKYELYDGCDTEINIPFPGSKLFYEWVKEACNLIGGPYHRTKASAMRALNYPPAIERPNGDLEWYECGVRVPCDGVNGPSIIYANGRKEWHYIGVRARHAYAPRPDTAFAWGAGLPTVELPDGTLIWRNEFTDETTGGPVDEFFVSHWHPPPGPLPLVAAGDVRLKCRTRCWVGPARVSPEGELVWNDPEQAPMWFRLPRFVHEEIFGESDPWDYYYFGRRAPKQAPLLTQPDSFEICAGVDGLVAYQGSPAERARCKPLANGEPVYELVVLDYRPPANDFDYTECDTASED